MALTIPVQGLKGQKSPMRDVKLTQDRWSRGYVQTLRSAYGKSPYFEHYFNDIADLLTAQPAYLADLNLSTCNGAKRPTSPPVPTTCARTSCHRRLIRSFLPIHKPFPIDCLS
jgi:WbqC-like protein family